MDLPYLLIKWSIDGYLKKFPVWAIMNNAPLSIHICIFMWAYVFVALVEIPRSGIAGLYGRFNFLSIWQTVFQIGYVIYIPTSNV